MVADVLDRGLEEVDSGVGARDAVEDCAAGPDRAFGEDGVELGEKTLEDGVGKGEGGWRRGDGGRVEGDVVGVYFGGA